MAKQQEDKRTIDAFGERKGRGGARAGAGRPKQRETKAIRVPAMYVERIRELIQEWDDQMI